MSHIWTAQFFLLHFCVLIVRYSYKSKFPLVCSTTLVLTEPLVNNQIFFYSSLLNINLAGVFIVFVSASIFLPILGEGGSLPVTARDALF